MATTLKMVGSLAMDLFYQDYAPRNAFFNLPDFMRHFANVYADMLNAEFQKTRALDKAETGFFNSGISAGWMLKERVSSTNESPYGDAFTLNLNNCIFNFAFDGYGYALDRMNVVAGCQSGSNCKVMHISAYEAQFLDIAPKSSMVYAWISGASQISLTQPLEVDVFYIPAVDINNQNCTIADIYVGKVIRATLDLMFTARNGTVIDESNDGNSNTVLQEQTNPTLRSIQQ